MMPSCDVTQVYVVHVISKAAQGTSSAFPAGKPLNPPFMALTLF